VYEPLQGPPIWVDRAKKMFRKNERRLYSYIPYNKGKNQQRISPVGGGMELKC